jgi:hypothetical protein
LEKDNEKENLIKSEEEGTEVQASKDETAVTLVNTKEQEVKDLIGKEDNDKKSFSKIILANVLDQVLIIAGSSLLLLLSDLILKIFGYMFVRDNGSLILAGGIIYFIINCIYAPIMEKSKLKKTFAKKILDIN